MATYPPRRLLGARPLPSDPRRDPRRSGFTQSGGGRWERRLPTGQGWGPRKLRCSCTHFQGPAARHHHLLRTTEHYISGWDSNIGLNLQICDVD
ncbi:uncharacterized protein LOC132694076 isoform X4 [Panthera onca]